MMSQITPTESATAAHRAFLLNQQTPHPVLQQIQALTAQYGTAPVVINQAGVMVQQQQQQQQDINEELGRMSQEGGNETISDEVFSGYRHREILPGCRPHPGDIVEAGPLAAITPPATYYQLEKSLPKEIISEGKLSSLQLEGVIHACQRHQMILPNGSRAGFFIGDAAGVGKGRQIAGIILDNFARSRTKSIWFTISTDLIVDTRRDLTDLGCYVKVIDGCQELDKHTRVLGLPADFKEGVVFSTYATLVSSVQKGGAFNIGKKSRLQQLVDWCGGINFDGCLIFDECHKAKNFVPGKEQASTKIAIAVTSIQRLLPQARVLYCSATGVTDVKNMAFMERLGLWGEGAPYKNFEQFLVSIQKKGLGMAEMLAMEMKSAGMYVSRGLSYKQAEFVTVEASLTPEQTKVYDTSVHVWSELRKALESAQLRTVTSNNRLWATFWSCHQRFFKQLCLGMKVPTIVQEAKQALDDGCCVVIGLQTTGEASLDSELGKSNGTISGFMSLCREILSRFIEQSFPTQVAPTKEGEIKVDPWSVTAKKMLLKFAEKITLPDSPLDDIIDKLGGPGQVAEMTGRKGRIIRHSAKDQPTYETRTPDVDAYGALDSLNVQERNMFMEGKKLVAIISDAASTGISLHADMRVANQRRRIHVTVELPWSADKAVQQLGRSHRSNQSSGPLYKLLTTNLGGERRFAAAVARRLQSMGALTKGDRRAATGADLQEFNFDTAYGRNALRVMYHHICHKILVPGISLTNICEDKYDFDAFSQRMQESLVLMGLVDVCMLRTGLTLKEKDTGDVSKFLNRILGLKVEEQNMIFTYFTECIKLGIQNAKKEGRYNEGMLDIMASSVETVGKPQEVFSEFNKGHVSTRLVNLTVDRGMSWEQVVTRADNHDGRHDGFYVSRRDLWGRKLYILATQKENSTHLFRVARPNTGLSYLEEEKTDILHRYTPIKREVAEKAWKDDYEATKSTCMHGSHCKNKSFCKVGSRCYNMSLLCGSIVTYMNVLEGTLNRNALKLNLSKTESSIRVVRVKLNDGERVVGIRYPEALVPEVEKALREQRLIESVQASQQKALKQQISLSQATEGGVINLDDSRVDQTLPLSQNGQSQPSSQETKRVSPVLQEGPQAGTSQGIVNDTNAVEGETGAVTQMKILKAVIEEVTEVNAKCLAKALRPPVTIKSFFKAAESKTKPSSAAEGLGESSSASSDKTSKSSTSSKTGKKGRNVDRKKSKKVEMSYDEFLETKSATGDNEESSSNAEKSAVNVAEKENAGRSDNADVESTPVTESSSNEQSKTAGSSERVQASNSSTSSRKRDLEDRHTDNVRPLKKAKQQTLFSTFQKMATKKEEEEVKAASCPICGAVFDAGTSNTELNSHIDNCIIE